tara:strand:+ start:661 stop:1350 length:690 start_codon:yes stop_codon:yes gene_type:complete
MPQLINKKKIYFYLLIFIVLSTILNYDFSNKLKENFSVKNIYIDLNSDDIREIILSKTNFLLDKNIFFINRSNLANELSNLNFLENIKVNKIYPSTIFINVKKTDLIAITYIDQKKYFLGTNGNFISSKEISIKKDLPIVFGKFKNSDFIKLRKTLIHNKIEYNSIAKYFFHKNKRWDLYLKKNIIIKLPSKNVDEAIKFYKKFAKKKQIKPGSIIDLRIPNRLIFKSD